MVNLAGGVRHLVLFGTGECSFRRATRVASNRDPLPWIADLAVDSLLISWCKQDLSGSRSPLDDCGQMAMAPTSFAALSQVLHGPSPNACCLPSRLEMLLSNDTAACLGASDKRNMLEGLGFAFEEPLTVPAVYLLMPRRNSRPSARPCSRHSRKLRGTCHLCQPPAGER